MSQIFIARLSSCLVKCNIYTPCNLMMIAGGSFNAVIIIHLNFPSLVSLLVVVVRTIVSQSVSPSEPLSQPDCSAPSLPDWERQTLVAKKRLLFTLSMGQVYFTVNCPSHFTICYHFNYIITSHYLQSFEFKSWLKSGKLASNSGKWRRVGSTNCTFMTEGGRRRNKE